MLPADANATSGATLDASEVAKRVPSGPELSRAREIWEGPMANGGGEDARERLLGVLLDKVAQDLYPSSTMLDVIEKLLEPDEIDAYAAILCEKIADEMYPSTSMINRLVALTG